MLAVCETARTAGERHLILLTGVPGAGKTLVGLQLVYHAQLGEFQTSKPAVFLSGNRALVTVLQHALGSKAFVQRVDGFLQEYGGQFGGLPAEHIWVFDEAQRAWDAQKVRSAPRRSSNVSEPEDFLQLGSRIPGWAVIVGLVGEDQEIHDGEETGIGLWNEALSDVKETWQVHCPPQLTHHFNYAKIVHANQSLCLTESVRSHIAEEVHNWVRTLLDGDLPRAGEIALRVQKQGFPIHVTRNLGSAQKYLNNRYSSQPEKRFGLLASSKANNLGQFEIKNEREYTKDLDVGAWYNDPPESSQSCTQMSAVATEFQCQGLELDFPVVAWGNDLTWLNGAWHSLPEEYSKARNPHQLRVNSYRVLLTRGRDGIAIFVPKTDAMDPTYAALLQATAANGR
ncbi:MAG: DUF2075 domain-containing protein [Armatimonadetes bacterium]|nr:DUF2075 domain-containing protein [Armatimonadota bacterium]